MSSPSSSVDSEEQTGADEERLLSTGLIDIRLERLLKRILNTPLQQEFLVRTGLRVPKNLSAKQLIGAVMNHVYDMNVAEKTALLKEAMFCKVRANSERAVWYTQALSGRVQVSSPRGRRKIARHIEHALKYTVEALVDRFSEGVWLVLFSRAQLQRLAQPRRMSPVSVEVFVWYPGEDALYCNRAKPTGRLLQAVCSGLGFAQAKPQRLYGRRLSSMRLMFTAKASGKFSDSSLPADPYPLDM